MTENVPAMDKMEKSNGDNIKWGLIGAAGVGLITALGLVTAAVGADNSTETPVPTVSENYEKAFNVAWALTAPETRDLLCETYQDDRELFFEIVVVSDPDERVPRDVWRWGLNNHC